VHAGRPASALPLAASVALLELLLLQPEAANTVETETTMSPAIRRPMLIPSRIGRRARKLNRQAGPPRTRAPRPVPAEGGQNQQRAARECGRVALRP
jgi:hypothetical protein